MPVVRLLGPVDVVDADGVVCTPGSPIRATLLGLLALDAGRVVESERLLDVAWDGDPPESGMRALRFHMSKLRADVGIEGLIVTVGSGYRLDADTDLGQVQEALAGSGGDDLDAMLSLWRGRPLGGTSPGAMIEHEQQRISELWLMLTEKLYEAQVDAGEGAGVIGELTRVCLDNPLREGLWASLITAHYQAGNQAEALRAYDRLRLNLTEALGVEPSPELQALQLQVLDQDAALVGPGPRPELGLVPPSGTVTFLFTDIEGSTRRWEADPDAMRVELAAHDDVLRTAIESHGGWMFKHTGDGVCAAFEVASDAVEAAVDAQRLLGLPVRMGLATETAEQRGEDYFGPALNRAARVMAVGHSGQILLSNSTAALVSDVDLVDLGEHRLRDLSGVTHLFQVSADGLASEFPRLQTVGAVPGNLAAQATSFVGRSAEVKELAGLVSQHRLVTLTGVGGVGKTRLAIQVAAELVPEFGDGVWLVELAPVGDPGAVPDAVATALGVTPQGGRSVTASVAETLAGRRLLVVLDNCEHVLDAAADLVEAILAASSTVSVIATSREGLRVDGEHLWPVPSLDVTDGAGSAAVELFTERAHAVNPGFSLESEADVEAVIEICRRLDGIALAIELAAARMVSMTPVEVSARLNDRFRLLSGSRRGLERHQTLRQAVQWSYDLLTPDEQTVLEVCSVFAGGFDLTALTAVCERFDEHTILDVLDSLVRKSLVTIRAVGGRSRYRLLETIRQFAEDQHSNSRRAETSDIGDVLDRHARYFANQAVAYFEVWEGPRHRDAIDWVEVEFDNLRAAFRWAADRDDLPTAAAIAVHTAMIAFVMQQFEPVGWAEELLPAAAAAELPQLPRLYTVASLSMFTDRSEDGASYAQAAVALQTNPRYQPFDVGIASFREAFALLMSGRADRGLEILTALSTQTGLERMLGLCGLTFMLPTVRRSDEAIAIAEDAINAARAHGNPYWVAFTYVGYGRAFIETDPTRALDILREGLAYTQEHGFPWYEALIARWSAGLEAVHGDLDQALNLFTASLDSFHQAGNRPQLAGTLVSLAVFFDRIKQPEIAATIYGATTEYPYFHTNMIVGFAAALDHLGHVLDAEAFDRCVRAGEAMNLTEAAHYAHHHINTTRQRQP